MKFYIYEKDYLYLFNRYIHHTRLSFTPRLKEAKANSEEMLRVILNVPKI